MDERLIQQQEQELAKTGRYYLHVCFMTIPLLCMACFLYGLRPLLLCGAALLTGKRHGHDEVWRAVCRRIACPEDRLAPQCAAAEENRKRIAAARGVYVVTCLGCGAESRYLRRGKVVQALEEKRGQIRCRRCGGKKFRLEKRYEQEEHEQ